MATIQHRRGSAAQWALVNPILADGEPAYETDSRREKIGDGSTPYNDLPYNPSLASQAQVNAGTDAQRAVTPQALATATTVLHPSDFGSRAGQALEGPAVVINQQTPIAAQDALALNGLHFKLASRQRRVDPWPDDRFIFCQEENFGLDAPDSSANSANGHKVMAFAGTVGTWGTAHGKFSLSATAGDWNALVLPRMRVPAPYAYFRARVVTQSGNARGAVGMVNGSDIISCFVGSGVNAGKCGLFASIGGETASFLSDTSFGPSAAPYEIMLVLTFPEAWGYINRGNGWESFGYINLPKNNVSAYDMRSIANFAPWSFWFGSNMANGESVEFSKVQCGPIGGLGTRDYKLVTYRDGTPYTRHGRYYVSVTMATGDNFMTNHLGVMSVNPYTLNARIESHLFFNLAASDLANPAAARDTRTACYGGQIVYDETTRETLVFVNTWGYSDGATRPVHLVLARTFQDVFEDVHVLDANKVTLPNYNGNEVSHYDNTFRYDAAAGLWRMACIESANLNPIGTRWPALFTSPDLTTWARAAVRQDLGQDVDGANWTKIGNSWYILAGGSLAFFAFDAGLNLVGQLPTWLDAQGSPMMTNGFPPHPCLLPIGENGRTRYLLITYDCSQSALTAPDHPSGTVGALTIFESQEQAKGQEFAYRRTLSGF